jgi:hypothetical protein
VLGSEAVVGSPPVEGVRFVKEEPVELKGWPNRSGSTPQTDGPETLEPIAIPEPMPRR